MLEILATLLAMVTMVEMQRRMEEHSLLQLVVVVVVVPHCVPCLANSRRRALAGTSREAVRLPLARAGMMMMMMPAVAAAEILAGDEETMTAVEEAVGTASVEVVAGIRDTKSANLRSCSSSQQKGPSWKVLILTSTMKFQSRCPRSVALNVRRTSRASTTSNLALKYIATSNWFVILDRLRFRSMPYR
jgi:hypothetical protein